MQMRHQPRVVGESVEQVSIGLDGIEDAFHKMHEGEVLRSVVIL